jgi:hypothetical protein
MLTLTTPTAWNVFGGDTNLSDSYTFKNKFLDVYTKKQILLNAMDAAAATRATWSLVSGTGKPQDYADRTANVDLAAQINGGATTIHGGKITTDSITASHIVSRTITADRIAVGAITANEILGGTITGDKIAANTIVTNNIATGNITTETINGEAVVSMRHALVSPNINAGGWQHIATLDGFNAKNGSVGISVSMPYYYDPTYGGWWPNFSAYFYLYRNGLHIRTWPTKFIGHEINIHEWIDYPGDQWVNYYLYLACYFQSSFFRSNEIYFRAMVGKR